MEFPQILKAKHTPKSEDFYYKKINPFYIEMFSKRFYNKRLNSSVFQNFAVPVTLSQNEELIPHKGIGMDLREHFE